jgi:PAS domain S-box-containing protein
MAPLETAKDREITHTEFPGSPHSRIYIRTAMLSWALVIGTLLIFASINIPYQKATIEESMISEARSIGASIDQVTATAIVSEDYGAVVEHCLRVVKESPSLLYVVITRNDGFSLINTKKEWKQTQLDTFWTPSERSTAIHRFTKSNIIPEESYHYSYPFQYSGIDWGWIHIGLSLRKYNEDVRSLYIRTIVLAFFCIVLAMIPSLIFARRLTQPIHHLDSVTRRVAEGDLAVRANVTTGDELERLAHSFNRMTESLQKSRGDLLSSREYTNNIISSMNDALFVIESSGTIKSINKATSKLLGYSEEELLGSPIQKIAAPEEEHPAATSLFQKMCQNNGIINFETVFYSKANQRITVLFSASPLSRNNDQTEGWVCVALNITERKKAEDDLRQAKNLAEKANKAKSEFLANMSHELRTPLNHILGFTELVTDKQVGELNEMQEEYLGDVLKSSRHLLSVINDILDLSKVEAGKLQLEISPVPLLSLIRNSFIMIKEKALKHGISLQDQIDGVPEVIAADERKLKQVLYNLLANAVKFTPEGGRIVLGARPLRYGKGEWADREGQRIQVPFGDGAEGDWVEVSVADSGIGLKEEDLVRIFAPFEQADNSASRKYQGTGLGLSLARQLVELHGGAIWAESAGEGKGSTFRFVIPLQRIKYPGNLDTPREPGA